MSQKTIRVRAGKGIRFPLPFGVAIDSNTRELTDDCEPVEVVRDRFIRGRLAVGDLVEVKDAPPPAPAKKKEG